MKTIFITAFNPFILRNILTGDALKVLKQNHDTRVVVFVPDYKVAFFQKEIGAENVIVKGVAVGKISRQDIIFRFVDSSLVNTPTLAVHKRVQLDRKKNYPRFIANWLLMKIFSRSRFLKRCTRLLDYLTISKDRFAQYFEKYQPNLIFTTDVFHDDDVHLLAEAKKTGVKTIGMVRSWDNFTTKGIMRLHPDHLIVHNEVIKNEAIKHSNFNPERIFVSGIPQYDVYFNDKDQRMPRTEFFRKVGLDPDKKLILFSPFGNRFTDIDWQIMAILREFIDKQLITSSQILVRLTPNDEVSFGNFVPNNNFYVDRPGHQFYTGVFRDQELTLPDFRWLADCLYHSDVIIAGGASIGIDAAIFGKPGILIHFDGHEQRPYWQSVRRFYEYRHATALIEMGAFRSAKSRDELLAYLRDYLENPRLGNEAREKMLIRQCWKLDGQAGKRIGDLLLHYLVEL